MHAPACVSLLLFSAFRMALRSWILLFPGYCAATLSAAPPLSFQFLPRVDEQQHHHARPSRSSVQLRSDLAGARDSSSPRTQQSWQDGAQKSFSRFAGKRGGGVCGVEGGGFRLERTPSDGLFPKQHNKQRADGGAAVGESSRGSARERCRRGVQHQQGAVNGRSGLERGVKGEACAGRGERIRWDAAPSGGTRTCGEYGATGGVGGTPRRRSWLYPRTQQQKSLRQQRSTNFAGCVRSGSSRRCTAVFMSTSMDDVASSSVDSAGSGTTRPTTGGAATGGERRRLGDNKGPNGEISDDNVAFAIPAGQQAKLLLPGATAAAATDQRGGKVPSRAAGAHAATTTAASPQKEDGSSGCINGFELEATAEGGEFADAEAMGPIAESYERGRWLLGLLVLQSTSSFVLDKYQDLLRQHVVVTLFLTMLVGAGGNAGNQSAIKAIRGLATGRFTADAPCVLRVVGEQAVVGLVLGTALAAGGFVRVMVTEGTTLRDASAISMSLFLIVVVSVMLGSGLPFGFARAGVDPAHAGTTIQVAMDIVGVVVTCVTCSFVLTQLEQALPLPL